jgi:hypothetical protein
MKRKGQSMLENIINTMITDISNNAILFCAALVLIEWALEIAYRIISQKGRDNENSKNS